MAGKPAGFTVLDTELGVLVAPLKPPDVDDCIPEEFWAGMEKKQRFLCVFFRFVGPWVGGGLVVVSEDSKSTGSKSQPVKYKVAKSYACSSLILARMRQPPRGCCHQHPVQVHLAR